MTHATHPAPPHLKFVRAVPTEAILQLMIGFLTSERTAGETTGIRLTTKLVLPSGGTFAAPGQPFERTFTDILELDDSAISTVAGR